MTTNLGTATKITTDTWLRATWEEFLGVADDPAYLQGRAYYDHSQMRVEMAALGAAHGHDNALLLIIITIFTTLKKIRVQQFSNTSFRREGLQECQPDCAFYIGDDYKALPRGNAPVNVDLMGPPSLVIEIGASSINDDLGRKRVLYERLGVREYWVVDVAVAEVFAFSVAEERSGRIENSVVLPGLKMAVVEETLRRGQQEDDATIGQWLMELFC
ncbi:Uma2 family endonuclease [Candidatus Cyanaurora vandensis]|uniref:Uma2 family endonuclease n=1 Tax=Candidatus Cyanaurora vandensis TaxID=2714958 RepID=UPI002579AC7E|nr:Uma2 family endonuclease [Candidatus Cyanaurora vandensis]